MLIKKEEKVPVVRLVSKYDDDYRPDNVHEPVVYTEATRIEDVLPFNKDDLQDPEPILIQAPTGFGKTWWILNVVLPVVIRQGGKLLIVSNRVAVSIQQKLAVVKIVEGKNSKWVKPPYSLILKDRDEVLPKSRTNSFDPWRQHAVGVFACGDVTVVFIR